MVAMINTWSRFGIDSGHAWTKTTLTVGWKRETNSGFPVSQVKDQRRQTPLWLPVTFDVSSSRFFGVMKLIEEKEMYKLKMIKSLYK